MNDLLEEIERLKESGVGALVSARMREFEENSGKPAAEVFKELCFCVLTANYSAERAITIQKAVGDGFITLSERALAAKLKSLGHRYPNARAKYVVEARKQISALETALATLDGTELRDWLAENIKGLGLKEASHFLRNIGYREYSILDFHVIDLLAKHSLIEKPKTLTKGRYLEIERVLCEIAEKTGVSLAELDLYLWQMETGKVLK